MQEIEILNIDANILNKTFNIGGANILNKIFNIGGANYQYFNYPQFKYQFPFFYFFHTFFFFTVAAIRGAWKYGQRGPRHLHASQLHH